MGLKQIKPKNRITFLKSLTTELLNNSYKGQIIKKQIQVQKLKQKLIEPLPPTKETFQPSLFQRPIYHQEKRKPIFHRISIISKIKKLTKRRKRQPPTRLQKIPMQKSQLIVPRKIPQKVKELGLSIKPKIQQRPEGFSLGKLEAFLKDPSIQSIECSGPGKNILIRKHNQVNITKTILNQEEITDLINKFSNQARIPAVGGILKAAVGDMVISAIISEFVGSRFIINKITPYSLINQ